MNTERIGRPNLFRVPEGTNFPYNRPIVLLGPGESYRNRLVVPYGR